MTKTRTEKYPACGREVELTDAQTLYRCFPESRTHLILFSRGRKPPLITERSFNRARRALLVAGWFFIAAGYPAGFQHVGDFTSKADCESARTWANEKEFASPRCFLRLGSSDIVGDYYGPLATQVRPSAQSGTK